MNIEIPEHISDPSDDYINFKTKEKCGDSRNYDHYNCFAQIMKSLASYEIEVHPTHNKKIDKENYDKWMELCLKYNILHKKCELFYDNDFPRIIIPRGMADRNLTYCTLCCYRWGITNQKLTYTVVQLIEKLPTISFWQILHYSLCKYIKNNNHSFSTLNNYRDDHYSSDWTKNNRNLASSIVLKQYFADPGKIKNDGTSYLNNTLISQANHLGQLMVNHVDDVLNPKWTPLYEIENPTAESLQKLYDEIKDRK